MPRPVLRFAPSPNGMLHLGHALSALTVWEQARRMDGRFLLRIEDIDGTRCRPHFVDALCEDLAWLGLTWEEPVLVQSQRFPLYAEAAKRLAAMGLLYPCFASRAEIAAAAEPGRCDPDGAPLYPGLWRGRGQAEAEARRAAGEPCALRLDMDAALRAVRARRGGDALTFTEAGDDQRPRTCVARPERWGDVVLVRKDTPASYHLAVVVDDAAQGVTHVTRGLDLFAATDVHRLLQVLLDLPEPVYAHHRLLTDRDGRKLAKSAGDTSLRSLREAGVTPAEVRARVGMG